MTRPAHHLHVAYSYSPKFRSYYAAAYVLETGNPGLPNGHAFRFALSTGMGDSANEAMAEALSRAQADRARADNITGTTYHGRKPFDVVKGYAFP